MSMTPVVLIMPLEIGDCCLYRPRKTSLFGRIIAIKTWHNIAHVEVYMGAGLSAASRDGVGVNLYPTRLSELECVLRPMTSFDVVTARAYLDPLCGVVPYGWKDLLSFIWPKAPISSTGMFCSELARNLYTAAKVVVFPDHEPSERIAPANFLLSGVLRMVWWAKTDQHIPVVITSTP